MLHNPVLGKGAPMAAELIVSQLLGSDFHDRATMLNTLHII